MNGTTGTFPLHDDEASPAQIGYTFLRHLGFILDELSSQGLEIWLDEGHTWRWRWVPAGLTAERGFWALGEALVDAVVARYPAAFATNEDHAADN